MNNNQRKLFIFGFLFIALGFIFKIWYREYIYSHDFYDFGIAGSAPSFFYTAGFSILLLVQLNRYKHAVILLIVTGSLFYEIYQWIQSEILDGVDMIASILGGFFVENPTD